MVEEIATTAQEDVLPQVAILQAIQKNMFCEAALEASGLVILGEAIRRMPEKLNRMELFSPVEFDVENNNDWTSYSIATRQAWSGHISGLTESFDFIVEQVIEHLSQIIDQCRVVAGTLRTRITDNTPLSTPGHVTLELLWVQENKEDE